MTVPSRRQAPRGATLPMNSGRQGSATTRAGGSRGLDDGSSVDRMSEHAVKRAYRRWAPLYDATFGRIAQAGRRAAVDHINRGTGRVLEVGVGTGLSLPSYARHLEVVGIDLSPEMLERARERVATERLTHVSGLHEMDAAALTFAEASFETVVAMYVMTVVPDPETVLRELARVTRPGGEVLLVNHFSQEHGLRGFAERRLAPLGTLLGWRPVFPRARVMGCPGLQLEAEQALRPFGLFTLLRFRKAV